MGEDGGSTAGHISKFKSQALTGGDKQRAWQAFRDKHKFADEEILRTAMGKFINLKLENGESLNTLFRTGKPSEDGKVTRGNDP